MEQKDEVFVGNTKIYKDRSEMDSLGIKYRLGEQSFDISGRKLPSDMYRPLFIHKDSYDRYNAMMQEKVNLIIRNQEREVK